MPIIDPQDMQAEIDALRAENAKNEKLLRESAALFSQGLADLRQANASLEAENEDLKAKLTSDESIDRVVWKGRAEKAEAQLDIMERSVGDFGADLDRVVAENEELKRALALVSQAGRADNEENERLRAAALSVIHVYARWEAVSRDGSPNDADEAWYAVGDAIESDLQDALGSPKRA